MNTPLPDGDAVDEPPGTRAEATELSADDADRFLADARGDEAIESARRRRWAKQIIEESTSVLATLHACLGNETFLILETGERVAGEIFALGENYVQVRTSAATRWISLDCVIAVEVDVRVTADPAAFDASEGLLVEVLEDLVAEELPIALTLSGGTVLTGLPLSVGTAVRLELSNTGRIAVIEVARIEMILLPNPQQG